MWTPAQGYRIALGWEHTATKVQSHHTDRPQGKMSTFANVVLKEIDENNDKIHERNSDGALSEAPEDREQIDKWNKED